MPKPLEERDAYGMVDRRGLASCGTWEWSPAVRGLSGWKAWQPPLPYNRSMTKPKPKPCTNAIAAAQSLADLGEACSQAVEAAKRLERAHKVARLRRIREALAKRENKKH